MLINLFTICSVYGFLLFSTGIQLQIDSIEGKSLSLTSNEDIDETTTTRIGRNDWNSEEDYGLGIIFDTAELDYYGRKHSPPVEPATETNEENATTDDIEKLVVTSKPYLTCGEDGSGSDCEKK